MKVKKVKNSKILKKVLYAILLMIIGGYLHAVSTPNMNANWGSNEPPYVLTSPLHTTDISSKKKYIAQIEAINSVDIIPQVSGYLEDILFQNGSEVKKGDKIFIIEQTQYKADLERAEAQVKQLSKQYERISSLNKQKYASDKEIDLAESNLRQAKATLEIAKLNLEHSVIKSPINGRIGKALVTKGNLVSPNGTKLARIVQTNPIRIVFSVSDKERSLFIEKISSSENIYFDIKLPNNKTQTIDAKNLFFDNEVNQQTATIPVYLDTSNNDNLLVPGNYVDIYVRFQDKKEAILVPQMALVADIHGTYVMCVNKDNIVEQKYIKLGDVIDDKQIVLDGLNGDERVIIQGLQKVAQGIKVNPNHLNNGVN